MEHFCTPLHFTMHAKTGNSMVADDVGHDLHIFSIRIDKARL